MKHIAIIFSFLFCLIKGQAQISFKTIVPQQPVISGESFQVQYTVEDGDVTMNAKPPAFNNFRFITGPNIYTGSVSAKDGVKPLRNAVYTLEATRPGRFLIPGATIVVNGKIIRSNDAWVQVISKEEAIKKFNRENGLNASDYFLRPGEDPYEKIKQNLFVKVMVDKKNCFVGQPVLATFKLYSRLESKSDIVKNPGFYGFTVYDMINLADKEVVTERINGKLFDVHTIRKVQLYPLQAGQFIIDAMQVQNKVEFSKSVVNKKTEQDITEGILRNDEENKPSEGAEVFETTISTGPISITVKPVPEKNKPEFFNGATGNFFISSTVIKNKLKKNEEGFFEIIVSGKGNFIQLNAPVVKWPSGIEGFEPTVKDVLDKSVIPLTGSRIFRYPFVSASPGRFQLPSVSLSFFNTDTNNYKTVTSKTIEVEVTNETQREAIVEEHKTSIAEKSERSARIAGGVVVLLVLIVLLYWIFKKKEKEIIIVVPPEKIAPSTEEIVAPAQEVIYQNDSQFYSILHNIIWNFAAEKFNLSGSEMNKSTMVKKMNGAGIEESVQKEFLDIISYCEAGIYTTADLQQDKEALLKRSVLLLNALKTLKT